jgi:ABC-2 type transport system permease protein
MWRRIFTLMIKEFLALLKDRRSRTVIIFPPIFQLLVFGYAATFDLTKIPFAVYNQDGGAAARELVADFRGSPNFHEVAPIRSREQMTALIDRKDALLIVHIRPEFTRDLALGQPADLQVILDGRNSNTAMVALNYVRTIVQDFNTRWAERYGYPGETAALVTRAWFNPNLESQWFIVPGIVGLLTLVVTLLVTALSVAREREQGTFDQLLVTPLRPGEILVGKALPGLIIGIGEATLIILAAVFWFEIPLRGQLPTLYTGVCLFILSTIGVGLMVSSLSVTQQQGLLGAFLFMVPAVILSGFSTPIANMPPFIQKITLLNPMRYFMVVLRGVFLEGASFELFIPQFWPMAVIGLVNLVAAAFLFRRRMY